MRKVFLFCLLFCISIFGNEAGKKRGREEMSRNVPFDDDDADLIEGEIGNFCTNENSLKHSRHKRAPPSPEWHSSDNDAEIFDNRNLNIKPSSGQMQFNRLVAAFLSDPECEGHIIFSAIPSVNGVPVVPTKMDFDALINSDCIAIERHNVFSDLSEVPSIATHWRKYCYSQKTRRPVIQDRRNLLYAIRRWMGYQVSIVYIPDTCVAYAAKLRLRLERARYAGAQTGAGNSGASSSISGNTAPGIASSTSGNNAPAPFSGVMPCRENSVVCNGQRHLCFENDHEVRMAEMCPITCRYCRNGETYSYDYAHYYGGLGCVDRKSTCLAEKCSFYGEDDMQQYCALTCRRCASFLRWGF